MQSWNWWGLIRLRLTAASNLYAFTFFMLTGLHAAHVDRRDRPPRGRLWRALTAAAMGAAIIPGITYAAMYVHFLDAIWLLLFAVMVVFA